MAIPPDLYKHYKSEFKKLKELTANEERLSSVRALYQSFLKRETELPHLKFEKLKIKFECYITFAGRVHQIIPPTGGWEINIAKAILQQGEEEAKKLQNPDYTYLRGLNWTVYGPNVKQ